MKLVLVILSPSTQTSKGNSGVHAEGRVVGKNSLDPQQKGRYHSFLFISMMYVVEEILPAIES